LTFYGPLTSISISNSGPGNHTAILPGSAGMVNGKQREEKVHGSFISFSFAFLFFPFSWYKSGKWLPIGNVILQSMGSMYEVSYHIIIKAAAVEAAP
jgi:hypothetical protein